MSRGEVRVEGLTWRPVGRSRPTVVDLNLRIRSGERVLVVGPSGAGKSTLLLALVGALGRTVAGDLSGTVEVGGRVGLVLQNPADSIVAEHVGRDVAFGLENRSIAPALIWPQVDQALASVHLPDTRNRLMSTLSGGELQRVALAGVLVTQPDVLLLDEPTSMLDSANAEAARDAVLRAARERTLIVVEHRFEPWLDHVDRLVALSADGEVTFDGTVADFRRQPALAGVWMPGASPPAPLVLPVELVAPDIPASPVEAQDVQVTLATRTLRGTSRTRALRDFAARLEPGASTAFIGPSGAGKSTALAVCGGLQRVDTGCVTPDRSRWSSRRLATEVGWVPQNPEHAFLSSTVAEEVAHTGRRLGRTVDVDAVLAAFSLASLAGANPFRLSGGEQRRLALAAALAHRPGVMLLDEPTVGQDPETWAAVVGWMGAARDAGAIVALSTHDADVRPDVVVRLEAGEVR